MSDNLGLGKIITGDAQRDAIHIAVAPVMAGRSLKPGQRIAFKSALDTEIVIPSKEWIGIVDPFLPGDVKAGQRFWMYLKPYTITSLRHDWIHPAFGPHDPADTKALSRAWMAAFAEEIGESYDDLMGIITAVGDGADSRDFGTDLPNALFEKRADMWKHWEIITGRKHEDHNQSVYYCAC